MGIDIDNPSPPVLYCIVMDNINNHISLDVPEVSCLLGYLVNDLNQIRFYRERSKIDATLPYRSNEKEENLAQAATLDLEVGMISNIIRKLGCSPMTETEWFSRYSGDLETIRHSREMVNEFNMRVMEEAQAEQLKANRVGFWKSLWRFS